MATNSEEAGGYSCEFVEQISDDVQTDCSICLQVLRNPQMVDCCSKRFCRNCISRVLATTSRCPLCNVLFSTTIPDKQLESVLKYKRVYCPSRDEGCSWVGPLCTLDSHLDIKERLKACRFLELRCKYCYHYFKKNKLEDHELDECPLTPDTCRYCDDFSGPRYRLDDHFQVCGQYPVTCTYNCGTKVVRALLEKHVNNDCPMVTERCFYAFCGCQLKEQRGELRKHYKTEAKEHLSKLYVTYDSKDKQCLKLQEEKEDLEEEIKELKSKLQQFEFEKQQNDKEMKLLKEFCDMQENGDDEDSQPRPETDPNEYRVLVGNFPYSVDEHRARSLLGQYGRLDRVTYYSEKKMAVVKYFSNGSVQNLLEKYKTEGIKIHYTLLVCVPLQYKDCTSEEGSTDRW